MKIMLSNRLKSQLMKILWITIGWTLISEFLIFMVHASLVTLDIDTSTLDYWLYYKAGLLTGLLAGLIGGTCMVVFWERWLRTKNYGWSLWSIWWSYTLIYFLVGIPTGLFTESGEQNLPLYHPRVIDAVRHLKILSTLDVDDHSKLNINLRVDTRGGLHE